MTNKSIALATSVAALLLAAGCSGDSGGDSGAKSQAASVECVGANSCKGHSECASTDGKSSCQGLNECKGMGWITVGGADEAEAKANCEAMGGMVQQSQAALIKCYGANECAGKGACQGAGHDCKGMNDCKGMGFIEVESEQACADAGGSLTG